MFHGWSTDLSWAWYTSCVYLYADDLGWALLILWGLLAVGWPRMALPGTSGLSSMWSFILQQAEFQREGKCVLRPLGLPMRRAYYLFHLVLLVKASHKASLQSRVGKQTTPLSV